MIKKLHILQSAELNRVNKKETVAATVSFLYFKILRLE